MIARQTSISGPPDSIEVQGGSIVMTWLQDDADPVVLTISGDEGTELCSVIEDVLLELELEDVRSSRDLSP